MNNALGTEFTTAADALNAKFYYFGGSARWLFRDFASALKDLRRSVNQVQNAAYVQNGLRGQRHETAVNHIIAEYPPDRSLRLVSGVQISTCQHLHWGMYFPKGRRCGHYCDVQLSDWVRDNPSVRGFVFEWDILAQARSESKIQVMERARNQLETWRFEQCLPLDYFKENGLPSNIDAAMIEPDIRDYRTLNLMVSTCGAQTIRH